MLEKVHIRVDLYLRVYYNIYLLTDCRCVPLIPSSSHALKTCNNNVKVFTLYTGKIKTNTTKMIIFSV